MRRSAAIHLAHIATGGDPFELGSSRPLDYGHWAAHKLEQLTAYRMRHGEAVAIGIALDTTYAFLSGFLPERDWQRVIDVMRALGLAVSAPELGQHLNEADDAASVLRGLEEFREHLGGQLTIMLLKGIGQPFDVHEIQRDTMVRSIEVLAAIESAGRWPPASRSAAPFEARPEARVDHERAVPAWREELADEYFIENRNRLLEIAAFLDRLDRADPSRSGARLPPPRLHRRAGDPRQRRAELSGADSDALERSDHRAAAGARPQERHRRLRLRRRREGRR